MFHHQGALEHLLAPEDYHSQSFYEREIEYLFKPSWQFYALHQDIARSGDYLARDVLGTPVVLHNVDGELHAFKNVCAHRHSMIVPPGKGSSSTLRCLYHGWEYGANGTIKRLPDGRSFKGLQKKPLCIQKYRVDQLGSLVFVNLSEGDRGFLESIGDIAADLRKHFLNRRLFLKRVTDHPVNWKVFAENSVESYHVPVTHPATFSEFRDEHLHDHALDLKYTRYRDLKPWGNSPVGLAARILAWSLIRDPTYERFTQTHVFPNYIIYYGDLLSLFGIMEPLAPKRVRFTQLGFAPRDIRAPLISRPLQMAYTAAFARMEWKIIQEDIKIWESIQHGLEHSHHKGVLSRREERVYTFQRYIVERMGTEAARGRGPGGP